LKREKAGIQKPGRVQVFSTLVWRKLEEKGKTCKVNLAIKQQCNLIAEQLIDYSPQQEWKKEKGKAFAVLNLH
jgi:hypothetical protein